MSRKPHPREPRGPLFSPEQGLIHLQESVRRGENLLDLNPLPEERFDVWSNTAFATLKAACGEDSPHIYTFVGETRVTIGPVPEQYAEPRRRAELERRIRVLKEVIDYLPGSPQQLSSTNVRPELNRKVFLVHGHEHGARDTVARFLQKLDLEPVILDEEPNRGRTIIEKFLERDRVCALYEPDVEMPSDITGMGYVKLDPEGNWRLGVAREINAATIKVDMNKLF